MDSHHLGQAFASESRGPEFESCRIRAEAWQEGSPLNDPQRMPLIDEIASTAKAIKDCVSGRVEHVTHAMKLRRAGALSDCATRSRGRACAKRDIQIQMPCVLIHTR